MCVIPLGGGLGRSSGRVDGLTALRNELASSQFETDEFVCPYSLRTPPQSLVPKLVDGLCYGVCAAIILLGSSVDDVL